LQIGGDLEDLESALKKEDKTHVLGGGSCSALVKLLPGHKDLFMSHDTWNGYQLLLRVLKKYNFGFHLNYKRGSQYIPGNVMTFSSYPGKIFSGDDFYLISTGLVSSILPGKSSVALFYKYICAVHSVGKIIQIQLATFSQSKNNSWISCNKMVIHVRS
jgi:hypothetical protein